MVERNVLNRSCYKSVILNYSAESHFRQGAVWSPEGQKRHIISFYLYLKNYGFHDEKFSTKIVSNSYYHNKSVIENFDFPNQFPETSGKVYF